QLLPYAAQVVENQYQFALAVDLAFRRCAASRHAIVWYEDFLKAPNAVLERLASTLRMLLGGRHAEPITLTPAERPPLPFRPGDEQAVRGYIHQHRQRFTPLLFPTVD